MQDTVDHDPVQLFFKTDFKFLSIFRYAVNANKNVAADGLILRIIKGNDIGKGIMVQVPDIDLKQFVIRTKNIIDGTEAVFFFFGNDFDPLLKLCFIFKLKRNALVIERDHILL